MFGPAPSGPRFPYPYRLLSRLPPVRTSARFFSSVPVVSPWRSKSPFLPAFRSESLEIPFRPLPSSFSQGHEIPDDRRSGLPFSNLGLSLPRGGHRDRLPFFHPGVIRQSRPEAFYGASEYAVERAGPYPHRLFSSPRLPGILFVLCSVKPCFPSVFGLSASTGNISSLPLLPECGRAPNRSKGPSDNMTCCRPIFGSPDGRPARRRADAAGRLCRRNGMNGCPCDIEEKEKSHNDSYATFVPSCFSGLCFPSSLEMRISGFR